MPMFEKWNYKFYSSDIFDILKHNIWSEKADFLFCKSLQMLMYELPLTASCFVIMPNNQALETYLKNEVEAGEEGACTSSYWSRRETSRHPRGKGYAVNSSSRGVGSNQVLCNTSGRRPSTWKCPTIACNHLITTYCRVAVYPQWDAMCYVISANNFVHFYNKTIKSKYSFADTMSLPNKGLIIERHVQHLSNVKNVIAKFTVTILSFVLQLFLL